MSPSHDGRSVAADKDEEVSDSTVPATTLELRSMVTDDGAVTLAMNRVDLPLPEADEVVVRIEAAPINPSDLGMLFAGADIESIETAGNVDLPAARAAIPGGVAGLGGRLGLSMPVGNEGGGTVVATGESAAARALAGKVVGFLSGSTYAQYRTVNVASCLPMHNGTRADDAAACFVNPLTALGMVETMRLEGHSGLVHTVGASNLGLMLNRICLADDVPLVNIVRRAEHVELLRVQGAHHVVDSSAATFFADLVDALRVTGATIAFDAIGGGELASTLLAAMEKVASEGDVFSRYGSDTHKQIYIYGGLDRRPTTLNRSFGMSWSVGGWLLTPFLGRIGQNGANRLRARVADEITTTFASTYGMRLSLAQTVDPVHVRRYARMATGEKALVTPQA